MSQTPTVSQTPSESAQEMRQRLAYEAAEKSYRTFRAEYNRVLRAGGANEPTAVMRKYAGDGYLNDVQKVSEAYKGFGYHRVGEEKINSVRRGGYAATALLLDVCEDARTIRTVSRKGDTVGKGEIRRNQLQIELRDGRWKLWSGSGKKVESCG